MKRALFIGRFQPFHAGHLSVLQALERAGFNEVIIGVGSSQYEHVLDNPFSFAERQEMITTVLRETGFFIPYYIVALPDIHDDARWVAHVTTTVRAAAENFDVVVTGNDWVKKLFDQANTMFGETRNFASVQPVEKVIMIEATAIRQMIRADDARWKDYVHPSIQNMVERRVKETK